MRWRVSLHRFDDRGGRPGDAEDLFEKQLDSTPDDATLRIRLAQLLREAGKTNDALEQIRTVLRKDGKNNAARKVSRLARAVTEEEIAALRSFLRDTFPSLADAPIAATQSADGGGRRHGTFFLFPHAG